MLYKSAILEVYTKVSYYNLLPKTEHNHALNVPPEVLSAVIGNHMEMSVTRIKQVCE